MTVRIIPSRKLIFIYDKSEGAEKKYIPMAVIGIFFEDEAELSD